ncbi:MAG: ABC transporter ATP-binding protein, partial [Firmicutes bacterium]|nr:ABC transporter ATP-binding protein [Bacillota bacterium]
LARSLTMDSKILLMDEPFSALDKQTTNILRDEVESIWEKTRKTVILITHSVEEAVYLSDEIVVLSSSPGVVKDNFKEDFERPRQIDSPEFVRYRQDILHLVRSEVEKNVQETCS